MAALKLLDTMLTTVVIKATNCMVIGTSHVSMESGLEAFPSANVSDKPYISNKKFEGLDFHCKSLHC